MMTSLQQSEPATLHGRPFGRQVRSVAGHALVAALIFVPQLFVFLPATVFHCSLRNGRRAAWAALALGTLLAAALSLPGAPVADRNSVIGYLVALLFGLGLPAAVLIPLVERGAGIGRVATLAVLLSAAGFFAAEGAVRAATGYSLYADNVAAAETAAKQFSTYYPNIPPEVIAQLRSWTITLIPAQSIIFAALAFILSLLMLGRLNAWREHAARLGDGAPVGVWLFRNLSLPEWLLFAFVAGGVTPLATGLLQKVAANVLAVVVFLYFMQGLAIFRFVLVASGASLMGTAFGFLMLAFLTMTGVAPLLLGVAGLFDSFFDFRRFKRKDHPDESHSD